MGTHTTPRDLRVFEVGNEKEEVEKMEEQDRKVAVRRG